MTNNQIGNNNTSLGYRTLELSTAHNNTAVGYKALLKNTSVELPLLPFQQQ